MTEVTVEMSWQLVAALGEEDFALGPEGDSVLLTLVLDILRCATSGRGGWITIILGGGVAGTHVPMRGVRHSI